MLVPSTHIPEVETNVWDKLVHLFVYAILTFLLLKGLYVNPGIKNYLFISAVISIGYSALLEFLQALVPGRGVDVLDLIANISGCIFSLIIFPFIGKEE